MPVNTPSGASGWPEAITGGRPSSRGRPSVAGRSASRRVKAPISRSSSTPRRREVAAVAVDHLARPGGQLLVAAVGDEVDVRVDEAGEDVAALGREPLGAVDWVSANVSTAAIQRSHGVSP